MIRLEIEVDETQIRDYFNSLLENANYDPFNEGELILSNKNKSMKMVFRSG